MPWKYLPSADVHVGEQGLDGEDRRRRRVLAFQVQYDADGSEVTSKGIYSENCKCVGYGFFVYLEFIGRKAAQTYIADIAGCVAPLSYMSDDM